jgi:hypothetical protein
MGFFECKTFTLHTQEQKYTTLLKSDRGTLYFPAAGGEYRRMIKSGYTPHHLYLLSFNKIYEGDYIKWHCLIVNREWVSKVTKEDIDYYGNMNNQGMKVEATSDLSLRIAEIGTEFLNRYAKSQGLILKVYLETTTYTCSSCNQPGGIESPDCCGKYYEGMKVDENGQCIIHTSDPVKPENIQVPAQVIKDCMKYIEHQQVYDKLSPFGDFYYKMKKSLKQITFNPTNMENFNKSKDEYKLRCKVVTLPTNDIGKAPFFVIPKGEMFDVKFATAFVGDKYKHIYFVSDREIKPGDWCLFFDSLGTIFTDKPQQYDPSKGHVLNNGLRKIEASTDLSINDSIKPSNREYVKALDSLMLTIPQSFVEQFVQEQGAIVWVDLELTSWLVGDNAKEAKMDYRLATHSDGTCIVCSEDEKIYTQEEMYKALCAYEKYLNGFYPIQTNTNILLPEAWFEQKYNKKTENYGK